MVIHFTPDYENSKEYFIFKSFISNISSVETQVRIGHFFFLDLYILNSFDWAVNNFRPADIFIKKNIGLKFSHWV